MRQMLKLLSQKSAVIGIVLLILLPLTEKEGVSIKMAKKEAPTIKTDRLTLRRLMECDIPSMLKMFSDDMTTKYLTGDTPPCNEHAMLKIVRARRATEWAIILNETNEFIGDCMIVKITQGYLGEIGCVLRHDFWNKGYAKEASLAIMDYCKNELGLKRLCAKIDNKNTSSKKLFETLGFELNAILPEADFNGRVCDVTYYSRILFEQFRKHSG